MTWLYYLLEANLYLLLFYGFYRLFLHNETFYNSNRYFLLLSSITSFVLPIMQLGFLNPTLVVDNELFPPPILYTEEQLAKITFTHAQETFNLADWLYPIYLVIALALAIKLSISLFKIIHLWLKAKKAKNGKITLIELEEHTTAFSFFNLLFIHPHLAEKETVLKHEMVHIKQKHSLDILFFEILQIICWFNPTLYFIKKDIRLLHEYIADSLSTTKGMHKHEYAMFLIENSFGMVPTPLTNQIFNQSILKSRINMLNKKRTANWARLRLLLALPLAAAMLCASTMAFTKSYGYVDLLPEKALIQQPLKKVNDEKQMAKKGYYSPSYIFDENSQYKSLEKRLIVVNGVAIENNNKYYGNRNADKILFLDSKNATDKYGIKGKYGAVEVHGRKSILKFQPRYVIADTARFPAPVPKQNQVKFPPPIARPQHQAYFYTDFRTDKKTGKPISTEKRHIVINGKPVADINKFYGASNLKSVKFLKPSDAIKKYGNKGKYGAVEITAANIKYNEKLVPPPPKESGQVKFPPPIVKPDSKNLKNPPAVEPQPSTYKQREKGSRAVEKLNITGITKSEIDSSTNRVTRTVRGHQIDRENEVSSAKSVYDTGKVISIEDYPRDVHGNKLNEVKVQGNQSKTKAPILVKGYPVDADGNKIKGNPSKVN